MNSSSDALSELIRAMPREPPAESIRTAAAEAFADLLAKFPPGDRMGFSESEAAAKLGITPGSLRELRKAGRIHPAIGGKGHPIYGVDCLLRFLAGDERASPRKENNPNRRRSSAG